MVGLGKPQAQGLYTVPSTAPPHIPSGKGRPRHKQGGSLLGEPEPASALPQLARNPCLPAREGFLHLIHLVFQKVLPAWIKGKGFWERESGKHQIYGPKPFSRFPELNAWILLGGIFQEPQPGGAITKTNGICKKPQKATGQEQLEREEKDPLPRSPPAQAGSSRPATEQFCYR